MAFVGEDSMAKADTMHSQWVPGVNALGTHGSWALAEFRSAQDIEADFARFVERRLEDAADIAVARVRSSESSVDFESFRSMLAPGRAP